MLTTTSPSPQLPAKGHSTTENFMFDSTKSSVSPNTKRRHSVLSRSSNVKDVLAVKNTSTNTNTATGASNHSRVSSPIVKSHSAHVCETDSTESLSDHSTSASIPSRSNLRFAGASSPCLSASTNTSTSTHTLTANEAIVTSIGGAQCSPDSCPHLVQQLSSYTASSFRSTATQTSPRRSHQIDRRYHTDFRPDAPAQPVMVDASTQCHIPSPVWQHGGHEILKSTTPTSPIARLKLRERSETPQQIAGGSTISQYQPERSQVDAALADDTVRRVSSREHIVDKADAAMTHGPRPLNTAPQSPRVQPGLPTTIREQATLPLVPATTKRIHSKTDPAQVKEEQNANPVVGLHQESSLPTPSKKMRPADPDVKVMPADYSAASTRDLVLLISSMLMELIRYNDTIPLHNNQLTRFHSRAPPGISVVDYLQRLTTHATLSAPILLSMVYYIDKLCSLYPAFTISSLTVHRFLITAATVASKGLSDSFWTNKTYAKVGGVSFRELALLELEFLVHVQWRIVPQPEVLVDYYRSLVQRTPGYSFEATDPGGTSVDTHSDLASDNVDTRSQI